MEILKEYPKMISTVVVGILVTYLTGKIPNEYLSPENVTYAQTLIGAVFTFYAGKFFKLSKTEAVIFNQIKKESEK